MIDKLDSIPFITDKLNNSLSKESEESEEFEESNGKLVFIARNNAF